MSLVDQVVAHVLQLEVSLYHASARLDSGTDSEALHDLRISVRRLRSLLRPLRGSRGVDALDETASRVGDLTTPVRDLEVLAGELRARGFHAAAENREQSLAGHYRAVQRSAELRDLFVGLDLWPQGIRSAERVGELDDWHKRLSKGLHKQQLRLQDALQDADHDPHRLRLLVKRNRYAAEAYPKHSPLSSRQGKLLKAAQSALGSWHDRHQWCLQAGEHKDLQPLLNDWSAEGAQALQDAESKLQALAASFKG